MLQSALAFQASRSSGCTFVAKRFPVCEENQAGSVEIGWRKLPLRVMEMSSTEFVALMDSGAADRLHVGNLYTLTANEAIYRVSLTSKLVRPDGLVHLVMEQVEEVIEAKVPRTGFFAKSQSTSLLSKDPLQTLAIIVFFAVALLIAPSVGGRWGTSQSISDAAQSLWKNITTMVSP